MRKKYFGERYVFDFIWEHADTDGIWDGSATTLAAEFNVPEDDAYCALGELCDRHRIQRIGEERYIISRWRERNESSEEDGQLLC